MRKDIGTYPTPCGGEVHFWYECQKVIVQHYDAYGKAEYRVAYDSLDEAQIETAKWYF